MLGIIFTGGESPPPKTIIAQLKGKTPFIVAADSGLIAAENSGFRPQYIIGDMDSLGDEDRLRFYPPECVKRYEHDKDYTDTELAMQAVINKGCDEIWIIGGGGGRIDHIFGIRSIFEREIFPSRWITDTADIRCIDVNTGSPACLVSCSEKNARVSVFPLGDGPWEAKSKGLKWPLDNLQWNRGLFGLSNVAEKKDFSVTAEKGRFMIIMEELWQQ